LEGEFPVDLGASVIGTRNEGKSFHVMCFDFLPERIDDSKKGELYIDTDHSVELTYCSKQEEEKLVFRGRYKPSKQCMESSTGNNGKKAIKTSKQTMDCILVYNEDTGRFTLECLQGMTNLKFQRRADSLHSRNGGNGAAKESPGSCNKRRAAPITPTHPPLSENDRANRRKRAKHRTEGSNSTATTPSFEPSPEPSQCQTTGNTNGGNLGDIRSSEQTPEIPSNSTQSTSTIRSPSIRASETASSSNSSSTSTSTDFTEGTTMASTRSSTSSAVSSPNCSNSSHHQLSGLHAVSSPSVTATVAGALVGMNGQIRTLDEQGYDSSDSDEFFLERGMANTL